MATHLAHNQKIVGSNPTPAPTLFYNMSSHQKKEDKKLWYFQRRSKWILEHGPCKHCGSWEDLEVDHIDRATKEYRVGEVWWRRSEIREKELAKCQVLCRRCHKIKTKKESFARCKHGTCTMYDKYKCRCDICRQAKSLVNKRRYGKK